MKINPKITLLLVTVPFICILSCNKSRNRSSNISADSLAARLTVLHDSLDHAWEVMISDDDEKIQFMKTLIEEVSYSGSYHDGRMKELKAMTEQLQSMRYDRKSMKNSVLIDRYDSATSAATRQVINFAYESPEYEDNDLMKRLVKDITDKNEMVLIYRVHYDVFAEEINNILVNYGDEIDTAGKGWQVWPLFRLSPDEI